MTSISFDRAVGYYDATRGYPPGIADQIASAIIAATHVPDGGHFLEIGIGTGRIALPIVQRGYAYTGIDISTAMVDQLRTKLAAYLADHPEATVIPPELLIGDSRALPLADATFDATIVVHVFHLISDWERALDEMLRVLRPGGWFLAGGDTHTWEGDFPNISHIWVDELESLGYQDPDRDRRNRRGGDQQAIVLALQARGLTVEQSRPVSWPVTKTPREEVEYIAQRLGSRTWDIPDDIFATSVQRLEARLRTELGERYDKPVTLTAQFAIGRAQKPA